MLNYLPNWKALRKTLLAASLLFGLGNCGVDTIGSYKTADETESNVYDIQETFLDLKTNHLDSIEEHLFQEVSEDISPDVACQEKIYYKDKDNDGYPKYSEDIKILCAGEEIPNGYIAENSWDCDDNNPKIHPDAIEICDSLDNDCDGKTDEGVTLNSWKDKDGDGQGDKTNQSPENCKILEGYVTNPLDCNDYDPNIFQSAPELCDNKDNDCDGKIDDLGQISCGVGECYHSADFCINGIIKTCDPLENAKNEMCDGLDNNCNGAVDENLTKLCYSSCGEGVEICIGGIWQKCDALSPQVEVCDNKDNDCDGATDEELTQPCFTTCGEGIEICMEGNWQNCTVLLPQPEVCDEIDNDCDGKINENLTLEQQCGISNLGICSFGSEHKYCLNGQYTSWQNCTAIWPQPEACDNLDNNCNGSTDENLTQLCSTACGEGLEICLEGAWQGCTAVQPKSEICDNLDNDCDGKIDEKWEFKSSKDNGDGTVTDFSIGLMWQKSTAGEKKSWENAISYCENLTLAEYSDWKLPKIEELRTLIVGCPATEIGGECKVVDGCGLGCSGAKDICKNGCTQNLGTCCYMDPSLDKNCEHYWSSSTDMSETDRAWRLHFDLANMYPDHKYGEYYVRCVREEKK